MKRIAGRLAAVLGTTLVLSLSATGAAHAGGKNPPMPMCGGGYVADALSSHLQYKPARWNVGTDPDEGTLGVDAPRGWSFSRTSAGEGRFHDPSGLDLLSLREYTSGTSTAVAMAAQVEALAGTSGLKIVGQHTKAVGDQTWSTLAYRYTSMGEPRTVKVRWIAYGGASEPASLVLTVAGRPLDGHGLDALLAHATPSIFIAG